MHALPVRLDCGELGSQRHHSLLGFVISDCELAVEAQPGLGLGEPLGMGLRRCGAVLGRPDGLAFGLGRCLKLCLLGGDPVFFQTGQLTNGE
ncbi:MAG: hypothetical protein DRJ42_11175 [Deltaproteobacteria bacterium]|nr:MAG: hypothetical protein DRJ42_11175 [Deltaproteobacteria bacterium]